MTIVFRKKNPAKARPAVWRTMVRILKTTVLRVHIRGLESHTKCLYQPVEMKCKGHGHSPTPADLGNSVDCMSTREAVRGGVGAEGRCEP